MPSQEKVVEILREKGMALLKQPYKPSTFIQDPEANKLLQDIGNFPHAFVLACVMDRQMKAHKAWLIPYKISEEIGGFEFSKLLKLSLEQINEIFRRKNLHRFKEVMAKNFYLGIQRIHNRYGDDASKIWENNPTSGTIVRRFLEFKGIGVKIATMAANSLARELKVPMKDYLCIDVSPDVHIKRVFQRTGLVRREASNDEVIYRARELNPEYPGVFDASCWEIGTKWCRPKDPKCNSCYLKEYCPKKL